MPVYAYDGWELAVWPDCVLRGKFLESHEGPAASYYPDQTFWDSDDQADIPYLTAWTRAARMPGAENCTGPFEEREQPNGTWRLQPAGYEGSLPPPAPPGPSPEGSRYATNPEGGAAAPSPPPLPSLPSLPSVPSIGGPDLSGFLSHLADIVADIGNRVFDVANSVNTRAAELAQRLDHAVSAIAADVNGRIADTVATLTNTVNAIADQAKATVEAAVTAVTAQVQRIADAVSGAIRDTLNALLPTLEQSLAAVSTALGGLGDEIAGAIPTAKDLGEAGVTAILAQADALGEQIKKWLTEALPEAQRSLLHGLEQEQLQSVGATLDEILGIDGLPAGVRQAIASIRNAGQPVHLIGAAAASVILAHFLLSHWLDTRSRPVWQNLEAELRNQIPAVAEAAAATRRGQIDYGAFLDVAHKHGFSDAWAEQFYRLTREILPPEALISAWLRGYLTPDETMGELQRRGLDERSADIAMKLATEVPTPGDLVTMMRREVFTPQISEPYGHYLEYPDGATPWFKKVGFDEDVAKLYWAAHWDVPSPTMFFEMFQRGIIGPGQLDLGLRAANIVPGWRESLTKLAYRPITRVDIRRLNKMGILVGEKLVKAYQDVGYSPEDAQKLALFTVKLSEQDGKDESAAFRAGIKSHILKAFRDGTVSEADAREHLKSIGYDEHETAAYFAEEAFLSRAAAADGVRSAVRDAFVRGLWPADRVRGVLSGHGFTDTAIGTLLDQWSVQRDVRVDADAAKHQRDLSAGQVTLAYKEHVIERPDADALLQRLGYDPSEARVLLAETEYAQAREEKTAQRETVHALLRAGRIDQAEAGARLDAIGITPTQREALLARWLVEQHTKHAALTNGELKQLLEAKIIGDEEARAELLQSGHSARDASLLLQLWGSQNEQSKAATAKREAARQATARKREEAAAARAGRAAQSRQRKLGRAEIIRSLTRGTIDRATALAELLGTGLPQSDAEQILRTEGY